MIYKILKLVSKNYDVISRSMLLILVSNSYHGPVLLLQHQKTRIKCFDNFTHIINIESTKSRNKYSEKFCSQTIL